MGWTFHLSAIGHTRIKPGELYPPRHHPEDRAFVWNEGRVINALQLVFISQGEGDVEWRSRVERVKAGNVVVLLPGEWHRYRPRIKTGWTEDWFELRGATVDAWIKAGVVSREIGQADSPGDFANTFAQMHELCASQLPHARAVATGLSMSLLARVTTPGSAEGKEILGLLHASKPLLAEGKRVREVARQLGLSYITFYRQFKMAVGITPQEYASQLRLARAENFLLGTSLPIKIIADRLGYNTPSHFSNEFKKARKMTPEIWRRSRRQNDTPTVA